MIRQEGSQNFLNLNLYLCRAIAPQGSPVVLQDQNGLFYAPDISTLAFPGLYYPAPPPFIPFMSQHGSTSRPTTATVAPTTSTTAVTTGSVSSPLRSPRSDGSFEQLSDAPQQS